MNTPEIQFLTLEDVLELHEMQLRAYGGAPGIRDRGLLESAVAQPQASFAGEFVHRFPFEMSAAYAFHIAENQPFIDGNKRTALASALVFLDWHRIEVEEGKDELYQAMIEMAQKRLTKSGLAELLGKLSRPSVDA